MLGFLRNGLLESKHSEAFTLEANTPTSLQLEAAITITTSWCPNMFLAWLLKSEITSMCSLSTGFGTPLFFRWEMLACMAIWISWAIIQTFEWMLLKFGVRFLLETNVSNHLTTSLWIPGGNERWTPYWHHPTNRFHPREELQRDPAQGPSCQAPWGCQRRRIGISGSGDKVLQFSLQILVDKT